MKIAPTKSYKTLCLAVYFTTNLKKSDFAMGAAGRKEVTRRTTFANLSIISSRTKTRPLFGLKSRAIGR